ncbi:hypothetical protein [Asanoa siamensis]|nr:hypothetical protein [Asanoa siamensis]
MMDGLSAVDWAALTHAYGSAADVPGMLRDLAGGDRKALDDLYGTIWHQGTVYEATAYAVPFLVEMLAAPGLEPDGVLGLLADIVDGASYLDVHRGFLPRSQRDTDEVREQMTTELDRVAAAGRAVAAGTPAYLQLLATHPDDGVRVAAAHLIGVLGPAGAGEAGAAALREAVARDGSGAVRAAGVLALGGFEEHVPEALTDPLPLPRLVAALVAGRAAPPVDALTQVIERDAPACLRLVDRLPGGAGNALAWVATALAPHTGTQVRLLTAWLSHADGAVRETAAHAVAVPLHTWRPAAAALVPALVAAAQDPLAAVRLRALRHLAGAGRAAAPAADLLWAAVTRGREPAEPRSPDHRPVAAAALTALARLHDPRADAHLATLLRARPPALAHLADAVAALGPWATRCRAAIVDAIEAVPAGYDRARLIRAAGRLGADPRSLVRVLRRQLAAHPHAAGMLLGDLGPPARAATRDLTALRASEDPTRQRIAARALWRITGEAEDLLTVLRGQLRDHHALETLAELGATAAPLAAEVKPLLDNDYEWLAVHAAAAYWHLTGDATPALPTLLRTIDCVPWGVVTVRTLAAMGPAATDAIPALRAERESPYRRPRWTDEHDVIAEDEGWTAICHHALSRIEGRTTGTWPDVVLPEPARQP